MTSIANSSWLRQLDGPLTRDLERVAAGLAGRQVPGRLAPDAVARLVCGFCATGCSLDAHLRDGQAVNLAPTLDYPVNRGVACPKGWEALHVLNAPDRARRPLLKDRQGRLTPVSWDRALGEFCRRFQEIQAEHGPESVAFLSTGQLVTEELALLGSLAKFGMGMRHGDGNTRQCMATAVTAYKESFGFDAPPYAYDDFEQSDVIVLVGSNLCVAHPIMWERVCRNPHAPAILVVDPRRTETAMAATHHLAIQPKSDIDLFYGIARELIARGWIDREFVDANTRGFAEFAAHVQPYTLDRVAAVTGLPASAIQRTARQIHQGRRVSFWWTMGVNQSYQGVRTAQSLINLALLTGNIGRPGTGANSITGQCNAMGSRLFSNTTSLLGGRDFANPADRADVARILELPVERIPTEPSWPYHRILEGIAEGAIRGLWIVCTNPAHSWIGQSRAVELLGQLDFLVVQDMYDSTETARRADLVLPAAGWGEKEGTFINSERRFGLVKRVARAPGEALADFAIFQMVADAWGCGEMFRQWSDPEAAFGILRRLSAGTPCDISGIDDYLAVEAAGGIQWPCRTPSEAALPARRLFEDGKFFHADRRARFVFEAPHSMPERPDDDYPYLLLTGRGSSAQWHTQTRTSKSPVLRELSPQRLYVEIHPDDAARESLSRGDRVEVSSRRGEAVAHVHVTPTVQPGQLFMPMHYEAVNRLTLPHFDPYSHQPSYKDCAVRIRTAKSMEPSA